MISFRVMAIIVALMLGACTQNFNKLEKTAPQPVDRQSLIHPPWEALEKAGPGAENDLDLETLNGTQQDLLVDEIPAELTSQTPPSPDTVKIDSIALLPVRGASKAGGRDLTNAMRKVLEQAGWPVVSAASPNALTLQGTVKLSPVQGTSQAISITWLVASPKGKNLGQVDQNNNIPPGSLDGAWGQVGDDIAGAAAQGIFKLINGLR